MGNQKPFPAMGFAYDIVLPTLPIIIPLLTHQWIDHILSWILQILSYITKIISLYHGYFMIFQYILWYHKLCLPGQKAMPRHWIPPRCHILWSSRRRSSLSDGGRHCPASHQRRSWRPGGHLPECGGRFIWKMKQYIIIITTIIITILIDNNNTLQTGKTSLTCPHWLRTNLTWSFDIALSDQISKSF